jgi:hypothetical protein
MERSSECVTTRTGGSTGGGAGPRGRFRRFLRAEDGSLIALSLYLFVGMLVISGVAIEIMRNEDRRVLIQNTSDRAVLAAADLTQTLSPQDVARDYFAKAGLAGLSIEPVVNAGQYNEWRSVELDISNTYPTFLSSLAGLDQMTVRARSKAIESIGKVEISLVLDISGSMGSKVYVNGSYQGTRISMLRNAATNFVNKMFANVQSAGSPAGKLAISVVPYNQQVVLGTSLGAQFNLSNDHTLGTCVDFFGAGDFSTPAVSPGTPLQRTMYGDSFDYRGNRSSPRSTWSTSSNYLNCDETSASSVLAFSNNQSAINTRIAGLSAGGYTSIDTGAKWGLALLDPAAQPVVDNLIAQNVVSPELSGRPFTYDNEETMKVMVLITDGQNTLAYSTKPEYRTGPTPLVSTRGVNDMSTYYLYYYDPTRSSPYYSFRYSKWLSASKVSGTKYPISYETLWNTRKYTLQYAVENFLGKPLNNATALYAQMAQQSEYTAKDANLAEVCTAAKQRDRNVLIFTIAVDAPSGGKTVLRNCATADAYYWDVTAADLDNAFAGIAASINSLRLTN